MRLAIDTIIALMLLAILGTVVMSQRREREMAEQIAAVQHAVRAIQAQALYQGALNESNAMPSGYARHIDLAGFERRPENLLIGGSAEPWLDYASPPDHERFHPARIVADAEHAAFWYNPYRGLVRARVPMQLSQEETVELYNLLNGAVLRVSDCRWQEADRSPSPESEGQSATEGTGTDRIVRNLTASKRR